MNESTIMEIRIRAIVKMEGQRKAKEVKSVLLVMQSEEDRGKCGVLSHPCTHYPSASHTALPHSCRRPRPPRTAAYKVCSHSFPRSNTMQLTPSRFHFLAQCASHHLPNKCYYCLPKRLHCVLVLHAVSRCITALLQPCINIYIAVVQYIPRASAASAPI